MKPTHRSVAELLRQALPPPSRDRVYSLQLLGLKWPAAVGNELAARSEPASFEEGLLTVRVTDAAWGRMILKLQGEIRHRLNQALGFRAVRRIRFVKDGKPLATPAPLPIRPPSPEPVEAPAAIRQAAESVGDADLRELVVRTASRYLAARAERWKG